MTRGFIVIVDGKKIRRTVYCSSDSYFCKDDTLPAGIILTAMSSDDVVGSLMKTLDSFIKDKWLEEEDFFKDNDEYKFYVKNKNNEDRFFVDYVYEYNTKTKKLTIYYYGTKIMQFDKSTLEYMDYVFENSDSFCQAFAYNEDTCVEDNDWEKIFNKFVKERKPVSEIKDMVTNLIKKNRFVLDAYKIRDCWGNDSYKKTLRVRDENGDNKYRFEFCFAPSNLYTGKYEVNIQLPYFRHTLFSNRSERRINQLFIEYIKNPKVQKDLINAIPLFEIYDKYSSRFSDLMAEAKTLPRLEDRMTFMQNKSIAFRNDLIEELNPYRSLSFSDMMRGEATIFNADAVERHLVDKWHYASRCLS